MSLGTEYTDSEYCEKSRSLSAAMKQLGQGIQDLKPGTDVYVVGSLGRRLVAALMLMEKDKISLDEYLLKAKGYLRPRVNFRGNLDVDIAVSSEEVNWSDLAGIAREITHKNNGIEIDPHFAQMQGEKIVYKCGYSGSEEIIDPGQGKVDLGNGTEVRPLGLLAGLQCHLLHGRIREQDLGEMYLMISVLQETNKWDEDVRDKLRMMAVGYLRSGNVGLDLARMIYHQAVPLNVRIVVSKIRHKSLVSFDKKFNFDEVKPVEF